jgi:cytochrome c556
MSRSKTVKTVLVAAIATMILFASAYAGSPVGPKLTPRLKILLTDEMQQVAKATSELTVTISAGDHATVNRLASAIRDSFILKQSLTEQDKKDLMSAVTPEFIALDKHFHGLAGKLAVQAQMKNSELQNYYFSRMLETCTACHSQFATDRFPGLAEQQIADH